MTKETDACNDSSDKAEDASTFDKMRQHVKEFIEASPEDHAK